MKKKIAIISVMLVLIMVSLVIFTACPDTKSFDKEEKTVKLKAYYTKTGNIADLEEDKSMYGELVYQWDGKDTISVKEANIYWLGELFVQKKWAKYASDCKRVDSDYFVSYSKDDVKLCLKDDADNGGVPGWASAFQDGFLDAGNSAVEDGGEGALVCYLLSIGVYTAGRATKALKARFAENTFNACIEFCDCTEGRGAKGASVWMSFYDASGWVWLFHTEKAY